MTRRTSEDGGELGVGAVVLGTGRDHGTRQRGTMRGKGGRRGGHSVQTVRDEASSRSPMSEAKTHEDGVGAEASERRPNQPQEHHVLVLVELLVDLVLLVDAFLKP
eukprot:836428-Rhodomonas_salina.1